MKFLKTYLFICFSIFYFQTQAVEVYSETVNFSVAKSYLKNAEKNKLKKALQANQFQLIGYTDSDGNEAYNLKLSQKRVQAVYDFLVENNIPSSKIEMSYKGEKDALNENTSAKEKAANRRVEIKYIIDPLLSFEVETQIFDVNNNAETYIKGKDGTEIFIPADAFADENVKIELKEYYSTLDILCSNLSTHSNDQPIETAGMIHMKAFTEDGTEVQPNNKLLITFENNTGNEGFEYFEGERDENLQVNWQVNRRNPNRDWFSSSFFRSNFSSGNQNDVIVSWLHTKNDIKFFDWMKYFSPNEFFLPENLRCFKETNADLTLDEYGNIIAVQMIADTQMLKCDKVLEKGRKKLFDKGLKEDPDEYVAEFKVIKLSKENKDLFKAIKAATSKEEKEAILAQINVVEESKQKVQFLTQKLGWINCDRFIREENTIDYVVEVPSEMNVRMIVNQYNAYFNSYGVKGNEYHFRNIPEGKEVTLICTKITEEGNIEVAIEETIVSKTPFSDFNFEIVNKEELKAKIESM